jgi:hypothetical protein
VCAALQSGFGQCVWLARLLVQKANYRRYMQGGGRLLSVRYSRRAAAVVSSILVGGVSSRCALKCCSVCCSCDQLYMHCCLFVVPWRLLAVLCCTCTVRKRSNFSTVAAIMISKFWPQFCFAALPGASERCLAPFQLLYLKFSLSAEVSLLGTSQKAEKSELLPARHTCFRLSHVFRWR